MFLILVMKNLNSLLNKNRLHLFVSGNVQRVGFRFRCRDKAKELGLMGHAKNLDDGSVEVVLQGGKGEIQSFVNWLEEDLGHIRIDKVEKKWENRAEPFSDFLVL